MLPLELLTPEADVPQTLIKVAKTKIERGVRREEGKLKEKRKKTRLCKMCEYDSKSVDSKSSSCIKK
ncbi:hypothetical protein VTP01DRAFT_2886 [Rhizomucor pusillus]|uniref:uncharacterized protein n=1 Tax=Rhizomucor pusillus TaxID=4840 RepID=UPI003742105F